MGHQAVGVSVHCHQCPQRPIFCRRFIDDYFFCGFHKMSEHTILKTHHACTHGRVYLLPSIYPTLSEFDMNPYSFPSFMSTPFLCFDRPTPPVPGTPLGYFFDERRDRGDRKRLPRDQHHRITGGILPSALDLRILLSNKVTWISFCIQLHKKGNMRMILKIPRIVSQIELRDAPGADPRRRGLLGLTVTSPCPSTSLATAILAAGGLPPPTVGATGAVPPQARAAAQVHPTVKPDSPKLPFLFSLAFS